MVDEGIISIFGVEPEYPEEEKPRKGRERPEIVDPYGWCSYESSGNKKITRIYKNGKVVKTTANGNVI